MSENIKTGIYAGVALIVMIVAVVTWPRVEVIVESDQIGEDLFPDFTEPLDARSLKIIAPDEEASRYEDFSIAKRQGLWVIPSHGNYPVDSVERLHEAALELVDLKVIDIATEETDEHAMYGVLEPDQTGTSPPGDDVGTQVVLRDAEDKRLAELIIGSPVQDSEQNRFVRIPGRNAVFVVEVSLDPFATRFQDWIKSDLLDLNSSDISEFIVDDYKASNDGPSIVRRFRLHASSSASSTPAAPGTPPVAQWEVKDFEEAVDGQLQPSELLPGRGARYREHPEHAAGDRRVENRRRGSQAGRHGRPVARLSRESRRYPGECRRTGPVRIRDGTRTSRRRQRDLPLLCRQRRG